MDAEWNVTVFVEWWGWGVQKVIWPSGVATQWVGKKTQEKQLEVQEGASRRRANGLAALDRVSIILQYLGIS
jgi:hypothetical protein